MAATYTVTEKRGQRMTFAGSNDQISVTWHKDYQVLVSGTDPASVDAYDVITANGIPVVNRSIYKIGNKIIPFVICRDKTAEQDESHLALWTVPTKWKASIRSNSEESDNTPIDPPAAVTDITPRVTSEIGLTERVLYEDKTDPPVTIWTPTENDWAEPAVEELATLTLRISQYEASITYEQALDRVKKVNEKDYRGQPPYSWLIQNIELTEVDIVLSGGPTTAALVTYTVEYTPRTGGWKDRRILIDTHYLDDTTDVKTPFTDETGIGTLGLVDPQGYALADGQDPEYVEYETYDQLDFGTFLQV